MPELLAEKQSQEVEELQQKIDSLRKKRNELHLEFDKHFKTYQEARTSYKDLAKTRAELDKIDAEIKELNRKLRNRLALLSASRPDPEITDRIRKWQESTKNYYERPTGENLPPTTDSPEASVSEQTLITEQIPADSESLRIEEKELVSSIKSKKEEMAALDQQIEAKKRELQEMDNRLLRERRSREYELSQRDAGESLIRNYPIETKPENTSREGLTPKFGLRELSIQNKTQLARIREEAQKILVEGRGEMNRFNTIFSNLEANLERTQNFVEEIKEFLYKPENFGLKRRFLDSSNLSNIDDLKRLFVKKKQLIFNLKEYARSFLDNPTVANLHQFNYLLEDVSRSESIDNSLERIAIIFETIRGNNIVGVVNEPASNSSRQEPQVPIIEPEITQNAESTNNETQTNNQTQYEEFIASLPAPEVVDRNNVEKKYEEGGFKISYASRRELFQSEGIPNYDIVYSKNNTHAILTLKEPDDAENDAVSYKNKIQELFRLLQEIDLDKAKTIKDVKRRLKFFLEEVNRYLFNYNQVTGDKLYASGTISYIFTDPKTLENHIVWAHLGTTRITKIFKSIEKPEDLTIDRLKIFKDRNLSYEERAVIQKRLQTWYSELEKDEEPSWDNFPSDLKPYFEDNELDEYLGQGRFPKIDIGESKILPQDKIVIASPGSHKNIDLSLVGENSEDAKDLSDKALETMTYLNYDGHNLGDVSCIVIEARPDMETKQKDALLERQKKQKGERLKKLKRFLTKFLSISVGSVIAYQTAFGSPGTARASERTKNIDRPITQEQVGNRALESQTIEDILREEQIPEGSLRLEQEENQPQASEELNKLEQDRIEKLFNSKRWSPQEVTDYFGGHRIGSMVVKVGDEYRYYVSFKEKGVVTPTPGKLPGSIKFYLVLEDGTKVQPKTKVDKDFNPYFVIPTKIEEASKIVQVAYTVNLNGEEKIAGTNSPIDVYSKTIEREK